MTLRNQIMDLGKKIFNEPYVIAAGFPRVLESLAIVGFRNQWGDTIERRAITKALDLMNIIGYVSENEPAVD